MSVDWHSRNDETIQHKSSRTRIILAVIILACLVGVGYATLGPQTTPAVTIPPKPVVNVNCATLSLDSAGSGINPNQGVAMLNCGTLNAISTTGAAGSGVSATPTFTLPTLSGGGTLILNVVQGTSCLSTSLTPLTTGTAFDFGTGSNYNYCLSYTGASNNGDTIPAFTITWA